ncbi:Trypsin-2 precursor [Minicystis rosea]|nr:Trypsin-2 precursor [Minicystis rosea]
MQPIASLGWRPRPPDMEARASTARRGNKAAPSARVDPSAGLTIHGGPRNPCRSVARALTKYRYFRHRWRHVACDAASSRRTGMRLRPSLVLCASLLSTSGCGTEVRDAASAISRGAVDEIHTSVVAILRTTDGELCTGQLIAPNLVLTAAHCTTEPTPGSVSCAPYLSNEGIIHPQVVGRPLDPSIFLVGNAATFSPAGPNVEVDAVLLPPDTVGQINCGVDLSLLRLREPLWGTIPIEPRLDLGPIVGETFTAVGYGATQGGTHRGLGTRHQQSGVPVTQVGPTLNAHGVLRTDARDWTSGEGPCAGDSGGPALDIAGRTFGVMSRGNPRICANMVYNGLAAHAAWIRRETSLALASLDAPSPFWMTEPTAGIAELGDDCRADTECASPLACRPIEDRFRCTSLDCTTCAPGWTCRTLAGADTCIPASDRGAASIDANPDARAPAGCAIAPSSAGHFGCGLLPMLAVLGLSRARRRERQ